MSSQTPNDNDNFESWSQRQTALRDPSAWPKAALENPCRASVGVLTEAVPERFALFGFVDGKE